MNLTGFNRLYWGFLFIMIDFKIQGFDILPDIVGYILFAIGLSILAQESEYFRKAYLFNIPMIILSLLSIYERPIQGSGIQLGILGLLGIPLAIVSLVLNLLIVYNLFMGIKEMARNNGESYIYEDANSRWIEYLILQLSALLVFIIFFIPLLAFTYIILMFVFSIVITAQIMRFMKKCGESLK